jgi:hypothetical protein
MDNLFIRAIGVLGLIICIWMFIHYTYPTSRKYLESFNWLSVTGEVIQCELDSTYEYIERKTKRGYKKEKTKMYQLQLKYIYSVDGQSYQGNGRTFNLLESKQSQKSDLEEFIANHPVNSSIEVYYDPNNPKEGTLMKGLLFGHWIAFIANIFFGYVFLSLIISPHLGKLQMGSG